MTDWPVGLPQAPQAADYAAKDVPSTLRSGLGYGPQNTQQQSSVYVVQVNVTLRIDAAQIPILETFYKSTLGRVLPFGWIDHKTLIGACPPDTPPIPTPGQYRFVTPPAYMPLGGAGNWNATFVLESLGDTGAFTGSPGFTPPGVPIFVLADPLDVEFSLYPQLPDKVAPCEEGTTYAEADVVKGVLNPAFLNRSKNQFVGWFTGGGALENATMIVWDITTDNLAFAPVDKPLASTNNRAYGFGYSHQGNGVLDRYAFFYRTASGQARMDVQLTTTDAVWKWIPWPDGDDGFSSGGDTLTRIVFIQAIGGGVNKIVAIEKDQVPTELISYDQTDVPAGHTLNPFLVGMPNRAQFIQSWITSGGNYAFSAYTPSDLGGTSGTVFDSGIAQSDFTTLNGATYDGTYVWIALGNASSNKLLKLDSSGSRISTIELGNYPANGGTDPWHVLDYDPTNGLIAMFWGDAVARFYDPGSGDVIERAISHPDYRTKFLGPKCTAYTYGDYDLGSGVVTSIVKMCVNCPENG